MTGLGDAFSSAIGSFILYIILSVVAFITSFYGPASAIFSIFQLLLVLSDFEVADQGKPTFPNFVAALVTTIMGGIFSDPLAYGFGIVVIVLILAKVFRLA